MPSYRIDSGVKTNAKQVIKTWKNRVELNTRKYIDDVIDRVGELFVAEAKSRLEKGYNTAQYARYIYYSPTRKAVIVSSPSNEPDIMWYLEFGTGIKGKNNPHPNAVWADWEYAINEYKIGGAWTRYEGRKGWVFNRESGKEYLTEDDIKYKGNENKVFTSGIEPLRYIYDTMQNLDKIMARAKRQLRQERKQIANG